MAAASCYNCNNKDNQLQLMKIVLLAQILKSQNSMADISPKALMAAAACYACVPPHQRDLLEIVLLSQLATTGGGGATAGNGVPTFTPGSDAALYIQKDSVPPGLVWAWYDGVWH